MTFQIEETIKTLRKMLEITEKSLENCERVVELLDPEMKLFEERSGHNTYVVRLAVDHKSESKRLRKEILALQDAIISIEKELFK